MAKKKQKIPINNPGPLGDMLARFTPYLDQDQQKALLEELEKPLHPSFRINPLKVENNNKLTEWAARYHWQLKKVPFCEDGYWVTNSQFPISKTIEHQLGNYYIQDAASMLPVELFDFNVDDSPLILDMASSPGGKTTHLNAKSMDKALILANDSSRDRLTALKIVLQNWGASHVAVTNYPGEYFGNWFPETFDRILLDAPCSMQGLRESESHAIKPITQKEINQLAKRQLKLLESALKAVKVNGQVVFSTCTLTIEENEMVLDEILKTHKEAIRIEPLRKPLRETSPAITQLQEFSFQEQVKNAARIWPFNFGTAGFFAAKITKLDSVHTESTPPPSRPLAQANWYPLPEKLLMNVENQLLEDYEFNLRYLMEQLNLVIWQFKNNLYCFPVKFLQSFPDFPVQALGLSLGELNGQEIQLSHDFVTRFGNLVQRNQFIIDKDIVDNWMRGEDLPFTGQSDSPLQIIQDHLGRILGRGKPSTNRLRNMLPKRILMR